MIVRPPSPHATRRDHVLLVVLLASAAGALTASLLWVSAVCTFAAIAASNHLNLVPYVRWPLLRRPLRHLPYFLPLPVAGWHDSSTPAMIAVACAPVVLLHVAQRKDIRLALSRVLGALMPPLSRGQKVSEALFFGLAGVSQEYLHRFVVLSVVVPMEAGALQRIAGAVVCATTFVLEHFLGPMRHTDRSARNVLLWSVTGLFFGLIVAFTGALLAVMIAHCLLNLPAALRPFARPTQRGEHDATSERG